MQSVHTSCKHVDILHQRQKETVAAAAPASTRTAAQLSDYPALDLIALDGFEQRAEVAFAEALVSLALNYL